MVCKIWSRRISIYYQKKTTRKRRKVNIQGGSRGRERNKGNICVSLNLIRIVSFFHQHQKDSKQFFKIFSKLGEAKASFPLVSFFFIYISWDAFWLFFPRTKFSNDLKEMMRVFSQSCFTVSKHVMASIHFYLNILKEYFISPFVLIFCVFNFSFLMKSLGVKLKFLGEKPVKLQTRVFYYCFAKFYHTSEKKRTFRLHIRTLAKLTRNKPLVKIGRSGG